MYEEILDDFESPKESTYVSKSGKFLLYSIILIAIMSIQAMCKLEKIAFFYYFGISCFSLSLISSLIGLLYGLISLIKKEPGLVRKTLSIVLNSLVTFLLIKVAILTYALVQQIEEYENLAY